MRRTPLFGQASRLKVRFVAREVPGHGYRAFAIRPVTCGGSSEGLAGDGFGVGFAVSFADLPEVAAEFLARYRDLRIQEEAYALLYQQYEYAKIMEARDTPTTTVLDHAVPPEKRSFPKRTRLVALVFLFGLVAGVSFALVMEYFRHISSVEAEDYRLLHGILEQLKSVGHGFRSRFSRHNN